MIIMEYFSENSAVYRFAAIKNIKNITVVNFYIDTFIKRK